ncbi:MAG: helix-turn-helix domain-containing protein [Firmicutes bacterium]|nr:helix-turn-helix domain-containing protein [Bacillota bacterium]
MALLTVDQAAEYLQISPWIIRKWLREKKLPGFKIGREWRIDEKDLNQLIEDAKRK